MKRGVIAYIGAVPQREAVRDAAARLGLAQVGNFKRLALFAGAALPVHRHLDDGVVLGDIFPLSSAESRDPGDGWGNYLSFTEIGGEIRIERAPLTGIPLYWARFGADVLCMSHLELVEGLVGDLVIDWDFIAHSISYINLRTERTGLTGLSELLPGSRLEVAGDRTRTSSLWSPWDHASKPTSLGIGDLAPELERRLITSMEAWSRSRPDVLLELSGGLDSSIVAAALHSVGASFSAVNFVAPRADGDERFYARAVAELCGAALVEAELGAEQIDLVGPPATLTPRPTSYAVLSSIDTAFETATASPDAAIFGGIGGDNIFGFDGSVAPVLDAWATFGFSRRTFAALRDVARAADTTAWNALRLSLRARRKGPRSGWRRETLFLDPRAVPARPLPHPWDEGAASALPARRNQVEAVLRILDFIDRPARWYDRDVVAPLLSQPVVEFCLSVPSWMWVSGGRDRAVARAAFAKRLPSQVVWRRGKGRIESVAAAAYQSQRAELRELLLGGRLASRGLLDRQAVETYLSRDLAPGDFDYYRLLEIADAERWVRSIEASSLLGPSSDQRSY